jgi:hypothetical protein
VRADFVAALQRLLGLLQAHQACAKFAGVLLFLHFDPFWGFKQDQKEIRTHKNNIE